MVRTFKVQDLDNFNSTIQEIINAAMFAIRATYHTTLKATPMQLVFGRDSILNIQFQADWKRIKDQKTKDDPKE